MISEISDEVLQRLTTLEHSVDVPTRYIRLIAAELLEARKDAMRYRALRDSGKYCASTFSIGWALSSGNTRKIDKFFLDRAADKLVEKMENPSTL